MTARTEAALLAAVALLAAPVAAQAQVDPDTLCDMIEAAPG